MTLKLINKPSISKEIYSDIVEQFPPEEIKSFSEFNCLLEKDNYKLGLIYDEEILIGYILYFAKEFVWVDYIAVLKEFHSKGYGSKILNTLFEKYSHLDGCYFEVEPEDETLPHTIRRMGFYKKLGCCELDFKYYFPNPIKNLELKLLYKKFNKNIPDKTKIKFCVNEIFNILHSEVACKNEIFKLISSKNM